MKWSIFFVCSLVLSGILFQPMTSVTAQSDPCANDLQFLAPMTEQLTDPAMYQNDMVTFDASVDLFWQNNMSEISNNVFRSPCVLEYEPAEVPFAEECALSEDIATSNAFYCVPVHAVMWDGPTFFHPIYEEWGDKATLYIIAHEYGHAAQFESGIVPVRSVNRELQADCYAGAYLAYAETQGLIAEDEYMEIVSIIAAVGQSRIGTNWLTRTHGTSLQREVAVRRGYQEGLLGCQVDLESLAEDGIERPLESLEPGESTIELPNGQAITINVPESGEPIEIIGPNGESIEVPTDATPCPPRLPRCQ